MKTICEKLKKDIIDSSTKRRLDPYKNPFQPKDLKLRASDYGSFSDHCSKGTTLSSKWCGCGLLKQVNKQNSYKYILIK